MKFPFCVLSCPHFIRIWKCFVVLPNPNCNTFSSVSMRSATWRTIKSWWIDFVYWQGFVVGEVIWGWVLYSARSSLAISSVRLTSSNQLYNCVRGSEPLRILLRLTFTIFKKLINRRNGAGRHAEGNVHTAQHQDVKLQEQEADLYVHPAALTA